MAEMWPQTLPFEIRSNPLRSAECKVYDRLSDELPDEFVVYYSRPWLGLKPTGEEIDGECDFLVAHANHGILAIEVKGGGVSFDSRTDRWTSVDRNKFRHKIKNPVDQAKSAKHEVLDRLKNSSIWEARWIPAKHGVVLPDSSDPKRDLGADMPKHIFCFAQAFNNNFGAWVKKRMSGNPTGNTASNSLGADGLRALQDIFAKPFHLRIALSTQLSEDEDSMSLMTQQQFHIMRSIQDIPRAAISGAAGTGKTVLAVEESVNCASKGNRTLFVCFNRGLADEIRLRLERYQLIKVNTFHGLCSELAQRAALSYPSNTSKQELFQQVLPDLLVKAFELLPSEKYDAIIVDEGQDFLPLWWVAIDSGLKSYDESQLRVFYDNNQNLYSTEFNLPKEVELVPIRLTLNLRNTKSIHEVVQKHYEGHHVEAVGPDGVEVSWIETDERNDSVKRISGVISNLVNEEQIATKDIAVLLKSNSEVNKLTPKGRIGKLRTVRCDGISSDKIVVDTFGRFKGLDRKVVILSATPQFFSIKELPYVALSRARLLLVVVGPPNVLDRLKSEFAANDD